MNDTVLKLRRNQFEALYEAFEVLVIEEKPELPAEKLVHTLLLQVWVKLRKLDVEYRPKYKLKLTPAEAQAFLIFWSNQDLATISFTGNMINGLIAIIHPKFS
jgi:hypothetical protein